MVSGILIQPATEEWAPLREALLPQVNPRQAFEHTPVCPPPSVGQHWLTLEHNGVLFPPEYVPHGRPVMYRMDDGTEKVIKLDPGVPPPCCPMPAPTHSSTHEHTHVLAHVPIHRMTKI